MAFLLLFQLLLSEIIVNVIVGGRVAFTVTVEFENILLLLLFICYYHILLCGDWLHLAFLRQLPTLAYSLSLTL
jgi:hypothetical protein